MVAESGATFACRLDGPSQAHGWSDCTETPVTGATTSTGSRLYTGLEVGTYTFSVRATDGFALGPNTDPTPAAYSWEVVAAEGPPDTDAPNTRITSGARRWLPSTFLGLTYDADEETVGFRCTYDGAPRSCGDGQANLLAMGAGDHTFTVAAVDIDGNVDPTPAVARWTVPRDSADLKTYSKKHWTKKSSNGYFRNTYAVATTRGAYVQQGNPDFRSLVVLMTRCPTCGKATVALGSKVLRTVDLRASTRRQRQVVKVASWSKPHSGKVTITVTTKGKPVIIEGLGFSDRR